MATIEHSHPRMQRCTSDCPAARASHTHYPEGHATHCGAAYGGPTSADPSAISCLDCDAGQAAYAVL